MIAWRRFVAGGALLLSLFLVSPRSLGQAVDYLSLVESYAHGDIDRAVATLASWPEERLRATDERAVAGNLVKAAAMLRTETALAVEDRKRADLHLERARSVLKSVPKPDQDQRFDLFMDRWAALEALVYGSYGDVRTAQTVLDAALRANPDSIDALIVRGSLYDTLLSANEPNPRGTWNNHNVFTNFDNVVPGASGDEALAKAAHDVFADLAKSHPESLEVRLRLGWALLINHSSTNAAREQFGVVAAKAQRADLRYLAHLFLGAVDMREARPDRAAAEFAEAQAILPRQASFMALIQADRARGALSESERLAAAFAATSPHNDIDPWQMFSMGLTDGELLDWLRAEARAR